MPASLTFFGVVFDNTARLAGDHFEEAAMSTRSFGYDTSDTMLVLGALLFMNLAAWVWAYAAFADHLAVMSTALLAWVFGLRHAVDADHIAAIDNIVRKLMQTDDKPKCVGLYFALGHSTIVFLATIVLSVTTISLLDGNGAVSAVGSLVAVAGSTTFLLLIALLNAVAFIGLWRTFSSSPLATQPPASVEAGLAGGGVVARLLRPMFRMVTKPWHTYAVGLIFGLGFDTATEIGVISISAAEAARRASLWSVLVFPALFAAGMALVDTADSVLMVSAYRWAFVDPSRKLWYNLTITGASVIVALFVGSVEALGLLGDRLSLSGWLWSAVAILNDRPTSLGFIVITLFVVVWLASIAIYHVVIPGHNQAFNSRREGRGLE